MVGEAEALIDSTQAARILGVSPGRIRQLVTEGKLTPVGTGRAHTFRRSQIERLAGRLTTTDPRDLAPAQAPLPRLHDTVLQNDLTWRTTPIAAHLRIFQGAADEGARTVIIVGRLTADEPGVGGYPIPDPAWGVLTEHIAQHYLPRPEDALTASWVLFTPTDNRELREQYEYEALIFDTNHEADAAARAGQRGLPWWKSKATPGAAALQLEDPRYSPLTFDEVDALIGQPLEYYPAEAYRPQVIEAYHRERDAVPYLHDGAKGTYVGALAEHLNTLTRRNPRIDEGLQERVAGHVADEIQMRTKYLDDTAWDDGTRRPDGAPAPAVLAARLERYRLTSTQRAQIERLAEFVRPWPWSDEDAAQAVQDMIALQDLAEDVGGFAQDPDPALEQAAREAAGIVRHYLLSHDYRNGRDDGRERIDDLYPRKRRYASVFQLGKRNGWDARYLDSVRWDSAGGGQAVTERDRNELRAALPAAAGSQHRFGTDLAGNPVAVVDGESALGAGHFVVLWPLLFGAVTLEYGARVVADGGDGARPVYLVGARDENIRPLPMTSPGNGWQFGYNGGGPGHLESSIVALIRRADYLPSGLIPRAVLEAAISYGPSDTLDLDLDKARRPGPPTRVEMYLGDGRTIATDASGYTSRGEDGAASRRRGKGKRR